MINQISSRSLKLLEDIIIINDLVNAKSNISTNTTDISSLETSFQDGCNTIMQAVTAKGSTPASNSPTDISTAINNIPTVSEISLVSNYKELKSAVAGSNVNTTAKTTVSNTVNLQAGKNYNIIAIAIGSVAGGSGGYSYVNSNWRIDSFNIVSSSNDNLQIIAEENSIGISQGCFSYKIIKINCTSDQTITATGAISGFYAPSISVGFFTINI